VTFRALSYPQDETAHIAAVGGETDSRSARSISEVRLQRRGLSLTVAMERLRAAVHSPTIAMGRLMAAVDSLTIAVERLMAAVPLQRAPVSL
jgi:hypothetical protein